MRAGKRPRAPASFLLARIGSHRLVLGAALVTAILTAALTAALASVASGALPQAVRRQLVTARGTSVIVSGAVNAPIARADDQVVRQSLRATFGDAVSISGARWSDPLGLPVPRHQQISLVQAAAPSGVRARAVLTAGSWPGPPARDVSAAVPAAVPAAVASDLHLAPGDMVRLRDRDTGAQVRFHITGVFRPRNRASPYWQLTPSQAGAPVASGRFVTYGPVIVAAAAFSRDHLAVGGASWLALPSTGQLAAGDLPALAARITAADQSIVQNGQLGGLQVSTGLPGVLQGIARNAVVAGSLLVIGELQLLLLAVAALALAASLLASQREGEIALLSARGGARWQLTRLGAAESVLLAVTAVVVGSLAGGRLASRLARSGPLGDAGLRLPAAPGIIWIAAGLVGLLCAVLLLWPTFRAAAPAAVRSRQARPARTAGLARAGADLALVAIALVAIWQLRRYQVVSQGAGSSLSIDPVLTAAPVFGLAAGTALLLRLVPLAARAGDRLAARSKRLGAALASWEISRQPVRQSAPVLLVVLAAATSTLALAQHQSWRRSIQDQAAFSVGADVQVNTLVPAGLSQAGMIARAPGVLGAMPVARTGTTTGPGEILALTARQATATVLLRPDLSALSPAALWQRITPARTAGLAVPGRPVRLAVSASLTRPAAKFGSVQAELDIMDAAGVSYSLPAGSLPADGRVHRLIADLAPRRHAGPSGGAADYPLRLTGIALAYTLPVKPAGPEVLTIGGMATAHSRRGRFAAPFSTGRAISGWAVPMSAPGLAAAVANAPEPGAPPAGPQNHFPPVTGRAAERLGFDPGYGLLTSALGSPPSPISGTITLTAPPAGGPIPAIATRAYLAAADLSVGDTTTVTFGATSVRARIAGMVTRFPTVTGGDSALIMDLAALQARLTSQSAPNLPVSQWWLRTRQGTLAAGLAAALPPGTTVASRTQTAASLLADPLSGLPQQALPAIALAAAALAAVGFSVSVAASVTKRQARRALLAALGVSRSAQAGQLCLEQLMLSVPAAGAGLLLGAGLARLLIRSVTLTAAAAAPVPPVLIEIPWGLAAGLAAAVAIIPVLAAGLTIAGRPDPAAQLRTAETG